MTREEAKLTLQANVIYACEVAKFGKETIKLVEDALDMAIEALSAEPSGDLISRADAVKAIRKCKFESDMPSDWYRGMEEAQDIVSTLPSADAVPQLRQTDTLIIADALRYLAQDTERHLVDRTRADALRQQFLKYGASMCKGGDDE